MIRRTAEKNSSSLTSCTCVRLLLVSWIGIYYLFICARLCSLTRFERKNVSLIRLMVAILKSHMATTLDPRTMITVHLDKQRLFDKIQCRPTRPGKPLRSRRFCLLCSSLFFVDGRYRGVVDFLAHDGASTSIACSVCPTTRTTPSPERQTDESKSKSNRRWLVLVARSITTSLQQKVSHGTISAFLPFHKP